jgi:DNA modification methylase
MNIETLRIAELTPDPNNARQHDDKNLKAIMGSLKEFGQRKPIVITEAGTIVAGNGTVEAAKRLGWTDIEVVRVPADWTDAQVKAFAIADNRTAELANWNQEVLTSQLLELEAEGWELAEFGFEPLELPDEDKPIIEDEIPESAPGRVALGDIWQLGNHRLMCGDAASAEQFEALMIDKEIDLIFTDPPYNVEFKGQLLSNTTKNGKRIDHYESVNTKHSPIKNDSLEKDQFYNFMMQVLSNLKSRKPKAYYFTFADLTLDELLVPLRNSGFHWKSILVWMKNQATLSNKDYKSRYEPIVYGCESGHFYAERYLQEDIWQFQRTLKNDLHPTMKPLALIENAIKNSSKEGQLVCDVFGGSGSTLIAAEQTKRSCYMMELDPKYCDVILERWEKLTGQKAELLPAKAD